MSVGDLRNNLRKLQLELRNIKYEKDLDLDSLSKGVTAAYLPIYHYLFLDYSHAVAQNITDLNIEMSGKTDLRFIEAMYKVLREMFTYKPLITKEQFFANSFVERKVIMCTEVIQLVKKKHQALAPKAPKSRPASSGTSQTAKLGPRPASTKPKEPLMPTKESTADTLTGRPPTAPRKGILVTQEIPVQVVNEIRRTVDSSMPSQMSSAGHNHIEASRSTSEVDGAVSVVVMDTDAGGTEIRPTVVRAERKGVVFRDQAPWDDMKAVVVTSSSHQDKSGQAYNPSRYDVDEEQEEDEVSISSQVSEEAGACHHRRPIDMIAMTPARPPPERIPLAAAQPETQPQTLNILVNSLQRLEKSVNDLGDRMLSLESQLNLIQDLQVKQNHSSATETEKFLLSAEKLETLLARMTLVENQVKLIECQKPKADMKKAAVYVVNGMDSCNPTQNKPDLPATIENSFCMSPIPSLQGVGTLSAGQLSTASPDIETRGRLSSTPNEIGNSAKHSKLDKRVDQVGEQNVQGLTQAERMALMVRSTKNMLNMPGDSPLVHAGK